MTKDTYLVITRKHIEKLSPIHQAALDNIIASMYLPNNEYIVCNKDEPYADKVIKLIKEEENK